MKKPSKLELKPNRGESWADCIARVYGETGSTIFAEEAPRYPEERDAVIACLQRLYLAQTTVR